MLSQIENTPDGYIVSIYVQDGRGYGHWFRLRNFGINQGDAIAFRDYDLPELKMELIMLLAKQFKKETIYQRIGKHRYAKI